MYKSCVRQSEHMLHVDHWICCLDWSPGFLCTVIKYECSTKTDLVHAVWTRLSPFVPPAPGNVGLVSKNYARGFFSPPKHALYYLHYGLSCFFFFLDVSNPGKDSFALLSVVFVCFFFFFCPTWTDISPF